MPCEAAVLLRDRARHDRDVRCAAGGHHVDALVRPAARTRRTPAVDEAHRTVHRADPVPRRGGGGGWSASSSASSSASLSVSSSASSASWSCVVGRAGSRAAGRGRRLRPRARLRSRRVVLDRLLLDLLDALFDLRPFGAFPAAVSSSCTRFSRFGAGREQLRIDSFSAATTRRDRGRDPSFAAARRSIVATFGALRRSSSRVLRPRSSTSSPPKNSAPTAGSPAVTYARAAIACTCFVNTFATASRLGDAVLGLGELVLELRVAGERGFVARRPPRRPRLWAATMRSARGSGRRWCLLRPRSRAPTPRASPASRGRAGHGCEKSSWFKKANRRLGSAV